MAVVPCFNSLQRNLCKSLSCGLWSKMCHEQELSTFRSRPQVTRNGRPSNICISYHNSTTVHYHVTNWKKAQPGSISSRATMINLAQQKVYYHEKLGLIISHVITWMRIYSADNLRSTHPKLGEAQAKFLPNWNYIIWAIAVTTEASKFYVVWGQTVRFTEAGALNSILWSAQTNKLRTHSKCPLWRTNAQFKWIENAQILRQTCAEGLVIGI